MASKKIYGSKSKHLRDMQEFAEKIKLKKEVDDIIELNDKKKVEIQKQKNAIANLFLKSNEKEIELKNYISSINNKMYSTNVLIDPFIEQSSAEIIKQIELIQVKIKKAIEYTKKEMELEIADRFTQAEQMQQERMNKKIKEQKEIYEKMNNARVGLDKIKLDFEVTNTQCDKLADVNEHLRIALDTVKSDNENLKKKLIEIEGEYEKISKDYKEIDKESNNGDNDEEENKGNDNVHMHNNELGDEEYEDYNHEKMNSNLEPELNNEDNENESKIKEDNDMNIDPLLIINLLKSNIKLERRRCTEISHKCADYQKQKNEATQLLQKCIDDINVECNSLPSYKHNPYDSEGNRQILDLDKKIRILTFIYDNALQSQKAKKLIIESKKKTNQAN